MNLKSKILDFVKGDNRYSFDDLAMELFLYQSKYNSLYSKFLELIGFEISELDSIKDVPLMPIRLFKSNAIQTGSWKEEFRFLSSGTGSDGRSCHLVRDPEFYDEVSGSIFKKNYISKDYEILALLPSYIENGNSSLVRMVDNLINIYNQGSEAFYMYDFDSLSERIEDILKKTNKHIILFGVSFALLDYCGEHGIDSSRLTIIFTGGMKNRYTEMDYGSVFSILKGAFPSSRIDSEYGMTEMFSQSYCHHDPEGVFHSGRSLRVLFRELSDPRTCLAAGKTGQLGFIDLANLDTLSFVLTDDLGFAVDDEHFKVLGRIKDSDLRGCNLLYHRSAATMPS